jgi:ABC-2 type transport system ATP-binding protein
VLAALDERGLRVASATVARPSLDDVYLKHTGHSYSSASTGSATVLENAS